MSRDSAQSYDLAQRVGQSLADLIDITAIFGSKSEILIKGEPLIDLTGMEGAITSRLAGLGYKTEVISIAPRVLIRLILTGGDRSKIQIPWLHILLFVLTVFSTLIAGVGLEGINPVENNALWLQPFKILKIGVPFSISLLSIMLFHEFGHYIAARKHNVEVTLPYFLPSPFISFIGTFGAVIRSKSAFINRRQLLDVGAAGPLAGLVVSFIVLIIGIRTSPYIAMPEIRPDSVEIGSSLLFNFLEYIIKGPAPETQTLMLNSVAVAGWAGLLITMLNLLPIGQLDGGHIMYALFGRNQKYFAYAAIVALVVLSFYWIGWAVWLVFSIFIKLKHPPTLTDEIPIGRTRQIIGYLCILAFILCFMPAPISIN